MKFIRKKRNNLWNLSSYSLVTLLIFVNVIVSLLFFILVAFNCQEELTSCYVFDYFALKPESIFNGQYLWTIITHMFVHGNLAHLFVNMFVLFSLGGLCERIIGRKRFLWFYLMAGLFAGILSVILAVLYGSGNLENIFGSPEIYMVGASGAIFGIAGLFVILLPNLRFSIIFLPFFSLPAYVMVPLILFLTWIVSYFAGLPIGNVAHFGGFLAGLAYGQYLKYKYRKKVMLIQRYFR